MASVQMQTTTGKVRRLEESAIKELNDRLRGPLLRPESATYAKACELWNGMIRRTPALIAQCTGSADVMSCVDFAKENEVLLSIRGGGHNVAGAALADGGLVIDLSRMRGVHVQPGQQRVRVAGGALLGDLDQELHAFGRAVPTGVVSATGVAGLTLHGGYGWLSRRWGLAADNLRSLDIVAADGKLHHSSPDSEPDLFWALQGGGGNFGVVTSFEFETHDLDHDVQMAMVFYPADQAAEALGFYREAMSSAPDELAAICVLWNAPEEEPIPAEMQGEPVVVFMACYSGPPSRAEDAIRPFQTFGRPVADLSQRMPFVQAQQMLDADYPDGWCYYWKSAYLPELNDDAIDILTDAGAARPSGLSTVDTWALGGAVARVAEEATPIAHRGEPFMIGIEANWEDPSDAEANIAWARGLYDALQERFQAGTYMNFSGFVEEGQKLIQGAYGENYSRLVDIKRRYDPKGLFRGKLSIAVE